MFDVRMGSRQIATACVFWWGCVLLRCRPSCHLGPLPVDRKPLLHPFYLRRREIETGNPPITSRNPDCRCCKGEITNFGYGVNGSEV